MAWHMLQDYFYFIRPNTLNIAGDPRKFGASLYTYQPMTLDGGFGFAAAIMEMLLQSWGGIIRIFPAIPEFWHDAYFKNLRAEGAFLVTAKMEKGKIIFVEIKSEVGGDCRIANPFQKNVKIVNCQSGKTNILTGQLLVFPTDAGDVFRLHPKSENLKSGEIEPNMIRRHKDEVNWFGLKCLPRF